jgi:hypothetical protein
MVELGLEMRLGGGGILVNSKEGKGIILRRKTVPPFQGRQVRPPMPPPFMKPCMPCVIFMYSTP